MTFDIILKSVEVLLLSVLVVIWIFHKEIENTINGQKVTNYELPDGLALPLLLVICGLFFDLLQFFYKTVLFHILYRHYEKKWDIDKQKKEKINFHPFWNSISYFFFYSKTIIVLCSYVIFALRFIKIVSFS